MPNFRIETNVSSSKITDEFLKKTSSLLAQTLGKPESYCVITAIGDVKMTWGGTTDPCAAATLMSIGQLGIKENKKHSAVLFKHIEEYLGVPPNRMYITYNNAPTSDVGYNGTTFHELFG